MLSLLEKDEYYKVVGEIYKITNITNGKSYIGQTRSHRLNKNKYRPFGSLGRFNDHISEATNSKKNVCKYLNNALIKYGIENFVCELIITCKINELDDNEVKYISEFKTKYPNGYNLTDGGQQKGYLKGKKIILNDAELVEIPEVKPKNLKRSDFTKKLISERLISFKSDVKHREEMMKKVQYQHLSKKFDQFKDVKIDVNNIDKYINIIRNKTFNYEFVRIFIEKKRTTFVGKFESINDIKNRAKIFLLDLIKWQNTLMRETP